MDPTISNHFCFWILKNVQKWQYKPHKRYLWIKKGWFYDYSYVYFSFNNPLYMYMIGFVDLQVNVFRCYMKIQISRVKCFSATFWTTFSSFHFK